MTKENKVNLICERKLEKYFSKTERALKIAEKSINNTRKKEAKEILKMVSCYLSDAKFFREKGNFVNSFACINYAHGWLDSGARLGIFKVNDNKLFVVK